MAKRLLKVFPDMMSMEEGESVVVKNEPWMPLHLTCSLDAEDLNGKIFILGHYHEQNGDLIADPEMELLVFNQNHSINDPSRGMAVFPISFMTVGVACRKAMDIEVSRYGAVEITRKHMSEFHDQGSFLNIWTNNIKQQGYPSYVNESTDPGDDLSMT